MPGLYGNKVLKADEITTGLAHLKEMGYTHVQLMPIMNFDGVDETIKNPIYKKSITCSAIPIKRIKDNKNVINR